MKSVLKKILLLTLIIPTLFSCKKDDEVEQRKGSVLFGFSISDRSGRIDEDVVLSHLIISAENDNGTVFEDEEIPLVSFDNEYSTEPISLNAGSYRLTKFLVAGEDGTVYYATPMEGSELAYLVSDPLPIHVVVSKDEVIEVKPEVVSTDKGTVEDFGYGEFGFEIVETFDVLLGVFVYNEEESDFVLTDSEITIYADSDSLTHQNLYATTNKLTLPGRFDEFTFEITKDGYNPFSYTFTSDSIKSYQGNNANGPLEIVLASLNVSEGLVAYYPFNGNANDESDNNNHGSVNGASLTTDRNGNSNSSYNFDGVDDYIDLGLSDVLSLGTYSDFSVGFWVKANSPNLHQAMFSKYISPSNTRYYSFQYRSSGNVSFTVYDNGSLSNFNRIEYPIDTEWHFLTWTYSNKLVKQYIDGVEVGSQTFDISIPTDLSNAEAVIGAMRYSTTHFDDNFNGKIDDLRIYNRALNESEINVLFNEN